KCGRGLGGVSPTARPPTTPRREVGAAQPQLPRSRISEEFDLLHALAKLVEHRRCALDDRQTVGCRLDAPRASIKKAYAKGVFEVGDRFRDIGLRNGEVRCRFRHTPGLHHGKQDAELPQFQSPFDVIRSHGGPYTYSYMDISHNRICIDTLRSVISDRSSRSAAMP